MDTHQTPLGTLSMAASELGLTRCRFTAGGGGEEVERSSPAASCWLDMARRQLDAYFDRQLREFTVPTDLSRVSAPLRRILDALREVEYGRTATYGSLAASLGLNDDGPRRVGAAMARNPLLIVLPCHRVVGTDGRLIGYAGGLEAKRRLLELEAGGRDLPALR